jgi:hypothetical protein
MPRPRSKTPEQIKPDTEAVELFYFLSYSTGEPHIGFFIECLEFVFGKYFTLERTPTSLEPGGSQYDAIMDRIKECAFGVVCLDGLRPNVVFEYGALVGAGKVALLFKEGTATVDVPHFYADAIKLAVERPAIKLDEHFSNTKDKYCPSWNRFELQKTVRGIWEAYKKRGKDIPGYIEIPEPNL